MYLLQTVVCWNWLTLALQQLPVKLAGILQANWHHLGGLKWTVVGVFARQKLVRAMSWGLWGAFGESAVKYIPAHHDC